jgi:hypothetical protein
MVSPMSFIEQKVTQDIGPYSAPLYIFSKSNFTTQDLLDRATVAFVNTGHDKFLITCHHVWEKFRQLKTLNPHTVMATTIGPNYSLVVLDGLRYVDGDSKFLDLAILRLPDPEIVCSDRYSYYPAEHWPNEPARQGNLVCLIGYAAQHCQVGENFIRFGTVRICDFATRVTDRHVSIRDDQGERQQYNHEEGIEPLQGELGGMSGSPAFVFRRGKFELIGFFTDGFGATNGQMLLSHAHFISPDGKLKPLPWT